MTTTRIHFRQEGEHRILSIEGYYSHEQLKPILKRDGLQMDSDRFMLTYK